MRGGAYDYWETGAAGEGFLRGAVLGGNPSENKPGIGHCSACHLQISRRASASGAGALSVSALCCMAQLSAGAVKPGHDRPER